MNISELMKSELIFFDLSGKNKEDVIRELARRAGEKSTEIRDREQFVQEVLAREALGSTGIGDEVAIPHARTDLVKQILIAFGRTKEPVDFDSIDGQPVRFLFLIAVPQNELKLYLTTLARLSRLVREKNFRKKMALAMQPSELIQAAKEAEQELESQ